MLIMIFENNTEYMCSDQLIYIISKNERKMREKNDKENYAEYSQSVIAIHL